MKKLTKKQRTESSKIDKCCKNCHHFEHGVCTGEFAHAYVQSEEDGEEFYCEVDIEIDDPNNDYCSRWR